jgi:hypothetical protein
MVIAIHDNGIGMKRITQSGYVPGIKHKSPAAYFRKLWSNTKPSMRLPFSITSLRALAGGNPKILRAHRRGG